LGINLSSGIPATEQRRVTGTMSSPWPPSTSACTSAMETFSSSATKSRKREVSSTPAIPTTRSLGKPVICFIA